MKVKGRARNCGNKICKKEWVLLPSTISSERKQKSQKKKKKTPADKWVGHAGKIICCHNPERSYQSVSWSTFKQKTPLRFKIPNIKIEHFSSIDNTNILSPHKEILFF
jgi:hypothetical protein